MLGLQRGSAKRTSEGVPQEALELHPDHPQAPICSSQERGIRSAETLQVQHGDGHSNILEPQKPLLITRSYTAPSTSTKPSEPLVSDAELFRDEVPGGGLGPRLSPLDGTTRFAIRSASVELPEMQSIKYQHPVVLRWERVRSRDKHRQ